MKKKWKLIFILAVIGAALLGAGGWWILKNRGRETAQSFRVIPVTRGDLSKTILTTGVVQPYNRLEIKPPIAGRIEQVLVEEGQSVAKGQILAWMSSTERAVLLDAARSHGLQELKRWETLYKPTPVIAPLNGTLIAKNVQSGQTVTQQDAVLVMSDRLIVKAQVDETDIGEVKSGQSSQIILDAYPRDKIPGRVDHIAYEAKIVNNVTIYGVDVIPHFIPPFMRSGMTANVTFFISEKNNVLILPVKAVHQEQHRPPYVMVSSSGDPKKAIPREVSLGVSDGKQIEINSGLTEGEKVWVKTEGPGSARKSQPGSPFSPFGGHR